NVLTTPALAVIAHYALGLTWCGLGAWPAARRHEEGIARYTPELRRAQVFRMGQDLGAGYRLYAALTLWFLGNRHEQETGALDQKYFIPHAVIKHVVYDIAT